MTQTEETVTSFLTPINTDSCMEAIDNKSSVKTVLKVQVENSKILPLECFPKQSCYLGLTNL